MPDHPMQTELTFMNKFNNIIFLMQGLFHINLKLLRNIKVSFRLILFLWGLSLSGGIFFAANSEADAKEFIRVLILQGVSQCRIQGQEWALQDLKTGQTFFQSKKGSLTILCEPDFHLRLQGYPISAPAFLITSQRGALVLNGRRYRDKLKILPGPNRELWVINELALEEYLVGLVTCEVPSCWPMEALKAQAVVARTYALFQKKERQGEIYDVDSSVNDQVYEGTGREDARSRQAVRETEGEIIVYQGNPIFALYHSTCGGRTESAENFLDTHFPYLKSAYCNFCSDSPHFFWNYQIATGNLGKVLENAGFGGGWVSGIEIGERSDSHRVLQLAIQGENGRLEISGKDFRRLLGYDLLRSTNFLFKENDGMYLFSGQGWGHGLGLCQWGAKGLADKGMSYRSILKYYYQKVELKRIFQ